MKNKKESLAQTNNNLLKQVAEHLAELRKQVREDNRIKYKLVWRKNESLLIRVLKLTDLFCMQVADNKILRELNHYLKSELRNYVPEHHMFQENNNQEETDGPDTEEKQLSFDFENVENIEDHKKH
tara:strand:- start:209 stop:586 length:378 start_codon:yes stop_codon:yes gene_type:complete